MMLTIALIAGSVLSEDKAEALVTNDSTQVATPDAAAKKLIVYYIHGTRRCVNCQNFEAYTKEVLDSTFAKQLESGAIEWQSVNSDEEGNRHFIYDYQLFTKSVVLSEVQDGKELRWKYLDKGFDLVRGGDKKQFMKYIQDEITAFIGEG
jgi:hypothetical protein